MASGKVINFACESCGRKASAPEALAGRALKCAGCGKTMTVPVIGGGAVVPTNAAAFQANGPGTMPGYNSAPGPAPQLAGQNMYPPSPGTYPPASGAYPSGPGVYQQSAAPYPPGANMYPPPGQPYYPPANAGYYPHPGAMPYQAASSAGNGMATASMTCGLVGLLIFGVILGPLALIFGIIALAQGTHSTGKAWTGIILGVIDFLAYFVILGALMNMR